MSAFEQLLYKFSSRGILWPAIYGSVFGITVFPFGTFVSAFIGALIGYLLMLPIIGMFTPITYTVILAIAAITGLRSEDPFWGKVAAVLLVIHIIRSVALFILVRKYPGETLALDRQYQRR